MDQVNGIPGAVNCPRVEYEGSTLPILVPSGTKPTLQFTVLNRQVRYFRILFIFMSCLFL